MSLLFWIRRNLTIEDECRLDTNGKPRIDRSLYQRCELVVFAAEYPRQSGLIEECVYESVVSYVLLFAFIGSNRRQERSHDQPSTTSRVTSLGCRSTDSSNRRDNI